MDPSPIAAFLSSIATIFTQVLTWVGSVCSTIVSNPLLLAGVGFFFVGGVVGILGRMLSRN